MSRIKAKFISSESATFSQVLTADGSGNSTWVSVPVIPSQAIASTTIDWSTGNLFTKTLSANTTFTFSNQLSGQTIVVRITNTASNYTVTWPGTVIWAGATPPTQTIGAKSDVYTFIYDGSDIYGAVVQNLYPSPALISATGGTITTDGDYKIHTFNSSGTFTITSGSGTVESLVVAGGGGGSNGFDASGGGGAGGLIYTTPGASYGVGSYSVTIGGGGTAGTNGGDSIFDVITATGGGYGGDAVSSPAYDGSNGGSGGGSGGITGIAGTGAVGQGSDGGIGQGPGGGLYNAGGGGGGAGGVGGAASGSPPGDVGGTGGLGLSNSITGTPVFYASGGGGATTGTGGGGTASAGGGGAGASYPASGASATANTGGGGGGGNNIGGTGLGGSGVVILRYQFQ